MQIELYHLHTGLNCFDNIYNTKKVGDKSIGLQTPRVDF